MARVLVVGGLLALCVAVGVGAASVLLPASDAVPGASASLPMEGQGGVLGGRIMRTSGTDTSGRWDAVEPDNGPAVLRGQSADPDGGLRWTVRIYRSLTGATCAEAGRTANGRFGRAGEHGELVPLPLEPAGACADLAVAPMVLAVNVYAGRAGQAGRHVAFGVAGPDIASIALVMPDGNMSEVPLDGRAFVIARAANGLLGARLNVTMRNGDVVERELP